MRIMRVPIMYVPGGGGKRLRWRLWWARYSRAVHRVAAQDEYILSRMAPIGEVRLQEHLVSSDVGVIHLRKRLNQIFYAQVDPD